MADIARRLVFVAYDKQTNSGMLPRVNHRFSSHTLFRCHKAKQIGIQLQKCDVNHKSKDHPLLRCNKANQIGTQL